MTAPSDADLQRLAERLGEAAHTHHLTVVTAESCTGGLIAAALTAIPGSSAVVTRGYVTYSNEAKSEMVGVPAGLFGTVGAVSEEVARAMAEGALRVSGAAIALSCTGIAGPGGGTPEKPVGTVCLCVSTAEDAIERTVHLPGGRADVRERTTTVAMHMLRRLLS